MRQSLKTKLISSLEKCFSDESIDTKPALSRLSLLRGQQVSFQLVMTETDPQFRNAYRANLRLEGNLAPYVTVRRVMELPVSMPCYPSPDSNYLRTAPGLYPDLLAPLDYHGRPSIVLGQLRTLWFALNLPNDFPAGEHHITVQLCDDAGEVLSCNELQITLIDAVLPPQELIFTQWFHCDCLAQYYGVEAFSEEHWTIIENFVRTAAANGINLLLTPIFTPPLDTEVGGERLTNQLVGVTLEGETYRFDFTLLDRWIDMADRCGIQYFEIAHFFTQWGAAHAPKIMATVNGEYRRLFGWDTDATGEAYTAFLRTFIPAFLDHMKARGDDRRCYFHVSDEPNAEQLEQYRASKAVIADLLEGYTIMDALSNFEFYSQGVVSTPIPSTNHIEPFLEAETDGLWTYYCCAQHRDVSNRFCAMPSARNRIIGVQLYKYDIVGFLHWGFNFYNTCHSHNPINPFLDTCGSDWVPAGDTCSVYPAPDGTAWESLRIVVFREALEDLRAFKLCEALCGRDRVMQLIEGDLAEPITFKQYPHSADYILQLRERVNAAIAEAIAK